LVAPLLGAERSLRKKEVPLRIPNSPGGIKNKRPAPQTKRIGEAAEKSPEAAISHLMLSRRRAHPTGSPDQKGRKNPLA